MRCGKSRDRVREFECFLIVDTEHSYFSDHPLDHVPGMLFMEAGRQMGIALSHLFLGVADDTQFISHDFRIRFDDIADLDTPMIINARFVDRVYRHGQLSSARFTGQCFQQGRLVCTLEGDWAVFDRKVYERLRRTRSGAEVEGGHDTGTRRRGIRSAPSAADTGECVTLRRGTSAA